MPSKSPGIIVCCLRHKPGPPSRALPNLENLEMVSPGVQGKRALSFCVCVCGGIPDISKPEGKPHVEPRCLWESCYSNSHE